MFVRGLPPETTIEDLIAHFSPRYALDKTTEYYPSKLTPFGSSIRLANSHFWWWLLFISPFVGWLVGALTDDPEKGAIGGLYSGLIIVAEFIWVNVRKKGNSPSFRKSPVELYDEEEKARKEKENAKEAKKRLKKLKRASLSSAKIYSTEEKKEDEEEEAEQEEKGDEKDPFRPNPRPVQDISNTGNAVYKGTWIAEISLVHPTGGVISKFKEKETSLKRMKVREVKLSKRGGDNASPAELKRMEKAKKRMEAKTKRLSQSVDPARAKDVTGAFIVFNCEESRNRCLEDYSETSNTFYRYFQHNHLKFTKGGKMHKLRVEQAPAPDLIFWENLHLTDGERLLRSIVTAVITILVLFSSFSLIYAVNLANEKAMAVIPNTDLCQQDLPTIIHGNRSYAENMKLVHNKTLDDLRCGGKAHITYKGYDYNSLGPFWVDVKTASDDKTRRYAVQRRTVIDIFRLLDSSNLNSTGDVFDYRLCDSPCMNTTGLTTTSTTSQMCGSVGCQLLLYKYAESTKNNQSEISYDFECTTYQEAMVQNCYCQQQLDELLPKKGFGAWNEMKRADGEGPLCGEFADAYFNAQYLAVAGALFIVAINVALKPIAKLLVHSEKHPNASAASLALVIKFTIAQFLNTAMIGLLINTKLNQRHVSEPL